MSVEIQARYLADRSVGGVDPRTLRGLNLTPKEAFFLSRIEGSMTVGDLVSITGMDRFGVSEVLNRLVVLGVVVAPEGHPEAKKRASRPHSATRASQPRSLTSWSSNLREQAKERKKQMLARQVSPRAQRSKSYARLRSQTPREPNGGQGTPVSSSRNKSTKSSSTSRIGGRPKSRSSSRVSSRTGRIEEHSKNASPKRDNLRRVSSSSRPRSHSAVIEVNECALEMRWQDQSIDESKLDAGLALDLDRQRELLQMVSILDALTPFELLCIPACDDYSVIRQAFISQSRWLHTDAYHGKELGMYRDLLEQVFHRVRKAYESLADPQLRAHYKKSA